MRVTKLLTAILLVYLAVVSPAGAVLAPVAYWDFNDSDTTSATATDATGNGHTGALAGTPTSVAGKIGQARNFSGTAANMTVTQVADINGNAFCLLFWVHSPAGAASFDTLVRKSGDTTLSPGWTIQEEGTTSGIELRLDTSGASGQIGTASQVIALDNTWHFAGFTADASGNWRSYLDGVKIAFGTYTVGTGIGNSAQNMVINPFGNSVNWTFDEMRLFNAACADSDVAFYYGLSIHVGGLEETGDGQ